MSEHDDMSFEILGTTPTNSYMDNSGSFVSSVKPVASGNPFLIESEMTEMRLSSGQNSPLSTSMINQNKENRQDVALDVLLRRKAPSAEMIVSGWTMRH